MVFVTPGTVHHGISDKLDDKYVLQAQLPWGGLCAFHRAEQDGQPVLVSLVSANVENSASAQRACRDLAQALYRADAPGLLPLLSHGISFGIPYYVYETLEARALTELLRNGPLSSADALSVAHDVVEALVAIHDVGLIHADITPANILVSRQGDRLKATVLGAGVAPLLRNQARSGDEATRTGSGQFSVSYMAPELFGAQAFEHHADLYSVGALIHHMVVGRPPMGWESAEGYEDVPDLAPIVSRAMARQPQRRFPHARAMLGALEWVDIESSKHSPHTQDIAPWMENSSIGSIPVPAIASSIPPPFDSHRPGTILHASTGDLSGTYALGTFQSGLASKHGHGRPIVVEQDEDKGDRIWAVIATVLALVLSLIALALLLDTGETSRDVTPHDDVHTIV